MVKTDFLREILDKHPKAEEVAVIVADPTNRVKYDVDVFALSDSEIPVICIVITGAEDFDEEENDAAEACELAARGKTILC